MEASRFRWIALGLAVAAVILAAVAVAKVSTREPHAAVAAPLLGVAPQDRTVAAKDVVKLQLPEYATIDHDGMRVIDVDLAQRLGVSPGELITAISGRQLHRDVDLHEIMTSASLLRANILYVELERDEVQALVRWQLDNSLVAARDTFFGGSGGGVITPAAPIIPVAPKPGDPGELVVAGITRVDTTHITITRAAADALFANVVGVLLGVRVMRAYPSAGRRDGFRISGLKPTSVLAHLGLDNGDVIEELRGVGTKQLQLVLTRRKAPLEISISVVK
jgi:hypothetical protein